MTTIGIIGAHEIGSQVARAAIASGFEVVHCQLARAREPEGPHRRAGLLSTRSDRGWRRRGGHL